MIVKIVMLYLMTWNCNTGELLYQKAYRETGFSVSGDRIEDCRIVGVKMARKLTDYYKQWYDNVSTNVDCQWEQK